MQRHDLKLMVMGFCSVVVIGVTAGEASAATKKAKEPAPAIVVNKAPKVPMEQAETLPSLRVKKTGKSTVWNKQAVVPPKQVKQAQVASKPENLKSSQRSKVNKKVLPKAVVQPKPDLTFHGMLEDPQRYDPRLNHRTAGVHDPQTPELAHDHFQDLDRNQDGKVDPVERAFGRLDMDRDLQKRQP